MRYILGFLAILLPNISRAECIGPSLYDTVSASERAKIDAYVAETPFGEGLIWHATRGDQTITLVGTMHIADPRHDDIFARVLPHLDNADALLVEAGPDELEQLTTAMSTDVSLSLIETGPTLPELLTEADWQRVRDAANSRAIPSIIAAKMQPWVLSLSFALPSCLLANSAQGVEDGLDQMITIAAQQRNLPITALEPWNTALNLLSDESTEDQLLMLRASAMSDELSKQIYLATADLYFAQRPAGIMALSEIALHYETGLTAAEQARFQDLFTDKLLIERNANWLPKIENPAIGQRILVAVGAAHLQGENGLLDLLVANGWDLYPETWR